MDAGCVFWGIIWFLILWFIGWPISMFLGAFYGFIIPLVTLIGLDDIGEVLLKGVQIGKTCAENVKSGKSLC